MTSKLDKLEEHIKKLVPPEEADFFAAFVRRLFSKANPGFLEQQDCESLAAITFSALKLLENKEPDEIRVRATNPRYEADGWEPARTVVEVTLSDRPFIVDSVTHELKRQGLELQHLVHPILHVERDEHGTLVRDHQSSKARPEVYELYLVEELEEERFPEIEAGVRSVLEDVKVATDDYAAMRETVERLCAELGEMKSSNPKDDLVPLIEESQEFLQWLERHHFVFLGYREYKFVEKDGEQAIQVVPETALGILRDVSSSSCIQPVLVSELSENFRQRLLDGPPIIVTKSARESTVHRPVKMDYIGLKRFDKDLNVIGEVRFLGLFTSNALTTPVKDIPILRRRLQSVLKIDEALEGSHDFKQIVTIFNSMPREELFWSQSAQLHRDIRTIMAMHQEHEVRLMLRPDPLDRGVLVMVIMPKDRFNSGVRHKVQGLLQEAFEARQVDYQLSMGEDEEQVRFHFFLTTEMDVSSVDLHGLESQVADLTRTWSDRLTEKLVSAHGETLGNRLGESFSTGFSDGYMENTSFGMTVRDVENLVERVDKGQKFRVGLFNPTNEKFNEEASSVRIYHDQDSLVLSEVLPILENLGLRVLLQSSHKVQFQHNGALHSSTIDVFRVQDVLSGKPLDVRQDCDRLVEAMTALLNREVESHKLNGLIVSAGLTWQEVSLLRTLQAYLSQILLTTSRSFIAETLLRNPKCAKLIYRFFQAKFQPEYENRESAMEAIKEEFFESLNAVTSLPADRTLRALLNVIEATVRCNYYCRKGYIALKIKSGDILEMPEPRPMFEIFVSGMDVEGTHLRGGLVARGGLRWSDRPDDFRTEVLGLMKTQMTKNAVIVPVGSKGGFVVKHLPADRDEQRTYVEEQYKVFIRGLLDLTDNIKSGKVIQSDNLVRYDGEDPYMVVAADKGTATFSDIANGISADYDFWLGDAFASGGSHGYDHKKQGITARGAWECVKRHFFELGIDVMSDEFTAAGIGDMAGDVFGNGMLYTDKIRLRAAFNHLHIFIDPDPNAALTYQERKRLFYMPRSSWADFDPALISKGGGVFERAAKEIVLTDEMREMFDTEAETMTGQEMIRAVLRMKVDLLWNGGIGNYVRASTETNAEVGDSGNDAVRIAGSELRCRVMGEGGNGGFTQLGRIEYALGGGRINTDAIDNSAGVDMSDHEVNIKILFQPLIASGDLEFDERNRILESMTDEVSQLVLRDNYWQSLCLSMGERRSREDFPLFASLLEYLSERGPLDRAVEHLPDSKALQERRRSGQGFTRPELAILLAYTKMGIYRRILETDFPDEPLFQHYLYDYFPTYLKERFGDQIRQHSLRREIIATQFTNVVVDLLGITFVHRTIRDTGATPIQVIRAALAALELVDAKHLLTQLSEIDRKVSADSLYFVLNGLVKALENVVNWIVLTDADLSSLSYFIEGYRDRLKELRTALPDILPEAQKKRFSGLESRFQEMGFEPELARYIASLDYVPSGIGIVDNARLANLPLGEAARRYYDVGERLQITWLRERLRAVQTQDKWSTIAIVGLILDLRQIQLRLSLTDIDLETLPGNPVKRYRQMLQEIVEEEAFSQASGDVLARLLGQIAEGARRRAVDGSAERKAVEAAKEMAGRA